MRDISRAQFLRVAATALPGWTIARRLNAGQSGDAKADRSRIASLIQAYDAQGIHRTATAIDSASADWLRQLATGAGGDARLVPFHLEQVQIRTASLTVDDQRLDGLPLFDGGFTGETGIAGTIGPPESNADIALVTFDQAAISSEGQSIAALRQSASHRAVVAITQGGTPGLSPSNARLFDRPFGVPVLQVASEHQTLLDAAAAATKRVTLVALITRNSTQAQNVVATIAGRQPDLAPLVVMTPRSGWWQCASERGGGLACWMEILRAVSAAKPARRAIFIASSGHELGHIGLDAFLKSQPSLIKEAAAWIHLGANIGAAGGQMRLQSSDDEIDARAMEALNRAGAGIAARLPRGSLPGGEARNIHVGGGRYVSLLGSGQLFHNAKDRWPGAVDLDAIARFARAMSAFAVSVVST